MTVHLNGEPVELFPDATVEDAVARLGVVEADERGLAVALEGEVVPRGDWASTPLAEGQRIEVVRAVQGG